MPRTNEKGRLAKGSPIPNVVFCRDSSEFNSPPRKLQAIRLTRRFAVSAVMAAALSPLVFGEARNEQP